MKPTIQIYSRFKNKGGAAIAARRLYTDLSRKYDQVSFIFWDEQSFFNRVLGKAIFFLDSGILKVLDRNQIRSLGILSLLPFTLTYKTRKADVVNLHWFHGGLISIRQIKRINKPLVLTLHDSWFVSASSHYPALESNKANIILDCIDNWIQHRLSSINNISAFVVPSTWLKNLLVSETTICDSKIHVIPNPIDTNYYSPPEIKLTTGNTLKIVVYFGGLRDPYKGGALLLEFLKLISKCNELSANLEFVIVGCTKNIYVNGLNVTNTGFISNEQDLVSIYQSCQLCLSFSLIENLPQFVTQAVSCGLGVMAFNVGGYSDIIKNDENGYLIPAFDLDEMMERLKFIDSNRHVLDLFGRNSRAVAIRKWSSSRTSEEYMNLFKSLLK